MALKYNTIGYSRLMSRKNRPGERNDVLKILKEKMTQP